MGASGVPQQSTLQGNEWRFFSFSLANTSTLGFFVIGLAVSVAIIKLTPAASVVAASREKEMAEMESLKEQESSRSLA